MMEYEKDHSISLLKGINSIQDENLYFTKLLLKKNSKNYDCFFIRTIIRICSFPKIFHKNIPNTLYDEKNSNV